MFAQTLFRPHIRNVWLKSWLSAFSKLLRGLRQPGKSRDLCQAVLRSQRSHIPIHFVECVLILVLTDSTAECVPQRAEVEV